MSRGYQHRRSIRRRRLVHTRGGIMDLDWDLSMSCYEYRDRLVRLAAALRRTRDCNRLLSRLGLLG